MKKNLFKDDRHLIETMKRGRALCSALGIREPSKTSLGSVTELREEWQRLRQEKTSRNLYYIVIEPHDGLYWAYPLTFPEIIVQGKTPEIARRKVAEALRHHLLEIQAQGKPLPVERKIVDIVVVPQRFQEQRNPRATLT